VSASVGVLFGACACTGASRAGKEGDKTPPTAGGREGRERGWFRAMARLSTVLAFLVAASTAIGGETEKEMAGSKKFIYLTQVRTIEEGKVWIDKVTSVNSDCLTLVWGKGEVSRHDPSDANILFFEKSSWNTGRNKLLRAALAPPNDYTYLIFLDGDMELVEHRDYGLNTGNAYRTFERYLTEWEPAVASPGFFMHVKGFDGQEVSIPYNFDAIFNAFHRDAIPLLLPYTTQWDRRSWWWVPLMRE